MEQMRRTTVDIDRHALDAAQVALGTKGVKLREVARSRALADFDIRRDIDGTAAEKWFHPSRTDSDVFSAFRFDYERFVEAPLALA
jgi:hypothetical protein